MASQRYIFLDVLRGFAVLWMIQVHITNVVLLPELRDGYFFHLLNISNGFVAPAFIFCAGSGMWIALSRKGADYLEYRPALWVYLKRLSYILFWGYALHVPSYSLQAMMSGTVENSIGWLQIDVLQTIVYSSLIALAVFLSVRNLGTATKIYGAMAVLISVLTPILWKSEWLLTLPPALGIMFQPLPHSPFPLLPWSGYLFAGAFFTGLFMTHTNKSRLAVQLVIGSIALSVLVFITKSLPPQLPWTDMWWQASPGLMLFRVSGITLLFGLLYLLENKLQASKIGRFMQIVGMESLFVYITHLLIVYGVLSAMVHYFVGTGYVDYVGVMSAWTVITLPLCLIMLYWHRLKKERPAQASVILTVQVAWMILSFLLTPAGFSVSELLKSVL